MNSVAFGVRQDKRGRLFVDAPLPIFELHTYNIFIAARYWWRAPGLSSLFALWDCPYCGRLVARYWAVIALTPCRTGLQISLLLLTLLGLQSRFGDNWGEITWNLSALSPKRDWSSKKKLSDTEDNDRNHK